MQKKRYSDHNFTCASIVKKRQKKQNKKTQKKDCACKESKKISPRMTFNY